MYCVVWVEVNGNNTEIYNIYYPTLFEAQDYLDNMEYAMIMSKYLRNIDYYEKYIKEYWEYIQNNIYTIEDYMHNKRYLYELLYNKNSEIIGNYVTYNTNKILVSTLNLEYSLLYMISSSIYKIHNDGNLELIEANRKEIIYEIEEVIDQEEDEAVIYENYKKTRARSPSISDIMDIKKINLGGA